MHVIRAGVVVATLLYSGPLFAAWPQAGNWEWYRSSRFGYSLLFPGALFRPGPQTPEGRAVEFDAADGSAKLKVMAFENTGKLTPREYRAAIVQALPGFTEIRYGPVGRSWFVLSGVRGPSIYYQKVLFACGGRVINAFALTYPGDQKHAYDGIVTTIEKNFRPASGPACLPNDGAGRMAGGRRAAPR